MARYEFGGIVPDSLSKNPVDSCVVTIMTIISAYLFIKATTMADFSGVFLIDSVYLGGYSITVEREDYLTSQVR